MPHPPAPQREPAPTVRACRRDEWPACRELHEAAPEAARLYRRCGFAPVGPPEPMRPGAAELSQAMERRLDRSA